MNVPHLPLIFRGLSTVLIVLATAEADLTSKEFDFNTFEHDVGLLSNGDWKSYVPQVNIFQPLPDTGHLARLRPCALERLPEDYPLASARRMNGYLVVLTEGGLNQISMGIANAVVFARVLNATLILPSLTSDGEWGDSSSFSDIYDSAHFISTLKPDLRVLKKLPANFEASRPETRDAVGHHHGVDQLVAHYLPLLLRDRVLILKRFHFQVGDNLPPHLERLRCRVLFHGLRFTESINQVASKIERKLRVLSRGGPFLGLHLRFDEFWLNTWKFLYQRKVGNAFGNLTNCFYHRDGSNPVDRGGGCFLTPLEVTASLKAMGIPPTTPLYLASSSIAGGAATMAVFHEVWGGNVVTKEGMMGEEIGGMGKFKTRLAAIDTAVAGKSDLLLMTTPKILSNWEILLQGQRFYWHNEKETFWLSETVLRPLFQEPVVNMTLVSRRILEERIRQREQSWVRGENQEYQKAAFAWPWHCVCDVE